jgi:hypothetical protein
MLDRPGLIFTNLASGVIGRAAALQNIRLGSATANPLSRSRNQRADEDGCLSFHLDECRSGFPVSSSIAENRCAAFFVSPVAPDSETRIAAAGAALRV